MRGNVRRNISRFIKGKQVQKLYSSNQPSERLLYFYSILICMLSFFSLFSPETTQDGTETSVLVYNNSCKKFGVTPRDSVLKHLLTDKLAINNGRLTRPDIQPLAYSLTVCLIFS